MRLMLPSYVPGFLYKYTSVARALEVLLTREVYFSHRRELNDPFDGRCIMDASTLKKKEDAIKLVNQKLKENGKKGHDLNSMLSGMSREEYYNRFIEDEEFANSIIQKIAKNMDVYNVGVYCLAEQNDSIIMWAHYANNHQGCCLEFNLQEHFHRHVNEGKECFPFLLLGRVRYSDKYPIHVFGKEYAYPEENSSYRSKSEDWKYENEWRALMYDKHVRIPISGKSIGGKMIDKHIIKKMKGSGHYPLDKDLLHGIILGYKMKDYEKKSIINIAWSCGIKIYEAHPKLYEYGMEIKPLNNVILVK